MADIRKALPRYLKVLDGVLRPVYKENGYLLDEKIERAMQILNDCKLCERACCIDRTKGEGGYCGLGDRMSVSGHYVGYNHDISVVDPSYDVFFLGCSFRCVFCQNPATSQGIEPRVSISETRLAKMIDSRSTPKVIDFVGGDPLPQLPFVLKVLKHIQRDIPAMWNSGFYMTKESMDLIGGIIDIYSPDFKYGNDDCAKRLSDVSDYTRIISRNIGIAAEDGEVIIRHLVMPNHIECCSIPVLDWISQRHQDRVLVHLMDQYSPDWKAKQYPDMSRKLRKREFDTVVRYAKDKGLNFVKEY